MPDKVVLIRPDGSQLQVDADRAASLEVLGYKRESDELREARNTEAAAEEYYGAQNAATAVEGGLRGLTFGASDYLFDNPEAKERAKYNPGIAMGSEIVGAVAPMLLTGGAGGLGAVARATPAARLARGAETAAAGLGLSGKSAKVVASGLEGAAFGGAGAANHAYLSGDPVTAEAVLEGVGWGALFGGGLSAAGSAVAAAGEAAAAKQAAAAAQAIKREVGALTKVSGPAYASLHSEAKFLSSELKNAAKSADAVLSGSPKAVAKLGQQAGIPTNLLMAEMAPIRRTNEMLNRAITKASRLGTSSPATTSIIDTLTTKLENQSRELLIKLNLTSNESAKRAISELTQVKAVQVELNRFPATVESFAKMGDDRAERLFATLEKAKGLSEFPVLGKAVDDASGRLSEAIGLTNTGVAGLRSTWAAAKKALSEEGAEVVKEGPGILRRAIGSMVGGVAGAKTFATTGSRVASWAAYSGAKRMVTGQSAAGLVTARNSTLGRLSSAVANYAPKAGKGLSRAAPAVEPLAVKLDGTIDNSTKNRRDLAAARIREVTEAQNHVRDTLYTGMAEIAETQPTLGPALHRAAIGKFDALRKMMPADPGVVSGLKSIWKPSDLQAAMLSRQLQVFHDPVSAAERMLSTGQVDPIQINALKEFAPAVYGHLRNELLEKVTLPGFMDGLTYNQQIGLGTMLDIPVHSSMRPEFIAASLQLHTQRNQPLPTPGIPGSSNGGRPAGDTPGATMSQKVTDR